MKFSRVTVLEIKGMPEAEKRLDMLVCSLMLNIFTFMISNFAKLQSRDSLSLFANVDFMKWSESQLRYAFFPPSIQAQPN